MSPSVSPSMSPSVSPSPHVPMGVAVTPSVSPITSCPHGGGSVPAPLRVPPAGCRCPQPPPHRCHTPATIPALPAGATTVARWPLISPCRRPPPHHRDALMSHRGATVSPAPSRCPHGRICHRPCPAAALQDIRPCRAWGHGHGHSLARTRGTQGGDTGTWQLLGTPAQGGCPHDGTAVRGWHRPRGCPGG